MTGEIDPKLISSNKIDQASKKLEIGTVGLIFGDASEKPGNIAATAMIFAMMLAYLVFRGPPYAAEILTPLIGIITGSVGFLFGQKS